jgi:hypothetical protein
MRPRLGSGKGGKGGALLSKNAFPCPPAFCPKQTNGAFKTFIKMSHKRNILIAMSNLQPFIFLSPQTFL